MCCFFQVSRSGYYDFVHRLGRPEKDAALAEIIAEQQERSFRTYGYRRMWLVLEKQGIHRNPKTILRIMEKYGLLSEIRRRRKWVNMGQQVHKYKKLAEPPVPCGQAQQQMGNGYFLHPHKARSFISVYDSGLVRQQHRGLQNRDTADRESGAGHHSSGDEAGEKEGRCGAPPPTATRGFSILPKRTST